MRYLLLLLLAAPVSASPYFRLINSSHVQKITGASIDPLSPGQTSFVSEVALITHSTDDGCLLPSIVCEDWSPLAIGPSYNAGRFAVVLGPVANLAPAVRNVILSALQAASPDRAYQFSTATHGYDGLTLAFGPQLWVSPFRDGIAQPFNKWQPAGRIFVGAALEF